jgi:hypothetical protein
VRPAVTYTFLVLYVCLKLLLAGMAVVTGEVALSLVWTEADQALWAGVLNFWFIGRIYERGRH